MKLIFEWDKNKANANLRSHHISFDEAKTVFSDPHLLTFPDEIHANDEERFISLGVSNSNRILLVVHTEIVTTGNEILVRIISCRKPTTTERKIYEG